MLVLVVKVTVEAPVGLYFTVKTPETTCNDKPDAVLAVLKL